MSKLECTKPCNGFNEFAQSITSARLRLWPEPTKKQTYSLPRGSWSKGGSRKIGTVRLKNQWRWRWLPIGSVCSMKSIMQRNTKEGSSRPINLISWHKYSLKQYQRFTMNPSTVQVLCLKDIGWYQYNLIINILCLEQSLIWYETLYYVTTLCGHVSQKISHQKLVMDRKRSRP